MGWVSSLSLVPPCTPGEARNTLVSVSWDATIRLWRVGSDVEAERLEKVYGAANYLAINRTEQMTTRLRRLMESAIGDAMKVAA